MESATPDRGVLDTGPDLIAVEADYRAGVMSVRAVAAKHGVSEGAVRKWAKNAKPEPWKRDLSEKVREAARAALVRVPVRSTHTAYGEVRTASEREVVDVAARAIVQVVREHRGAIQAGQQMVGMLLGQLQEAAASRDELEETIEADTMGTGDGPLLPAGAAARSQGRRAPVAVCAVPGGRGGPDGHLDLWAREHYKSTIITFAGIVQEIAAGPRDHDLHLQPHEAGGRKFLLQIKQELERTRR
jgi:hypothetical protein